MRARDRRYEIACLFYFGLPDCRGRVEEPHVPRSPPAIRQPRCLRRTEARGIRRPDPAPRRPPPPVHPVARAACWSRAPDTLAALAPLRSFPRRRSSPPGLRGAGDVFDVSICQHVTVDLRRPVWSLTSPVAARRPITIGRPIPPPRIYVSRRASAACRSCRWASSLIGGGGASRAVLDRPELHARSSFRARLGRIPMPASPELKDLVRSCRTGTCTGGRIDHQFKILAIGSSSARSSGRSASTLACARERAR